MGLDERKRLILQAIVEDYINTAEPVGSRSISKRPELNLSAATIRNEMGDLEEMGLLVQPHTSAGRVPSHLGYRLYVDSLMKKYEMTANEIEAMQGAMLYKMRELDKIVRDVSAAFSAITNLPTVSMLPRIEKGIVKSIKLVKIDEQSVMLIIATGEGMIKNKLLRLKNSIDDIGLSKINTVLNENLSGLRVSEIGLDNVMEVKNAVGENFELLTSALELVHEAVSEVDTSDVFMEGSTNILRFPEYSDVNKIKEIFELFENKAHLGEIIKLNAEDSNVKILIGDENNLPELKNNSVILSPYKITDDLTGVIGVIGPVRMDYSKIVSSLEYFSDSLSKMFKERYTKELNKGDDIQ